MKVNETLRRLTFVKSFKLSFCPERSEYDLELELSQSEEFEDLAIFEFRGVSELSLSAFGGGLTQFAALRCTDIRDRGMEQIKFEVREAEYDSLNFYCRDLRMR